MEDNTIIENEPDKEIKSAIEATRIQGKEEKIEEVKNGKDTDAVVEKQRSSKRNNSKVQFSEGVSNKEMDMDFYHNRGKDSNLDLRALEKMETIDFSSQSEEEIIKPKKKKKKSKKSKKKKSKDDK